MPLSLVEEPADDPRNAAALCAACDLAYLPADQGAAAFRDQLGLEATLVCVDNTQVYLAQNAEHVVVAFRGSENPASLDGLKDWLLTNALNLLVQPQGPLATEFAAAGAGARFHQGFVTAITAVWPQLFPAVEAELKRADRPLWVTGHSLGGALALLAAWLFKRKFLNVHQVVTFGAPMVGNKDVAEAIGRELAGKVVRYVNSPDPVPLLPMMSLVSSEYLHCDRVVGLGDTAVAANLLAYLRDAAGGVAEGVLAGDLHDKVWGAIQQKVNAHLLTDYRALLGGS
ncbi:lipase family protein [Urbifossiella limnaea]|uniref:Lipase (Class 3) n=1 Tax=Urbifossiella limnaea TaxID=2528023 RepID=A0A517XRB8_9BACT|nr:lipase family protein [Urbifossiella limnaea]QDU20050.1 Lipase (class 3) [Urbifossiella limnaea]